MRYLVLSLILCGTPVTAQPLTDAQIAAALVTPERTGGVRLGETWNTSSGFRVAVYSPIAWIRHLKAQAQKEMRPFTLADVTEDMRADVWRLKVSPSVPRKMNDTLGASSVSHAVLRNQNKTVVIQPLTKEPFAETVQSMGGAHLTYEGMDLTFPGEAVRALWGPQQDQEFWISVVGPDRKYDFEVKDKYFDKLK